MPQEETKKAGVVQSRGRPGDMVGSGGQGLAMLEAAKVGRTGPKDKKFLVSPSRPAAPLSTLPCSLWMNPPRPQLQNSFALQTASVPCIVIDRLPRGQA